MLADGWHQKQQRVRGRLLIRDQIACVMRPKRRREPDDRHMPLAGHARKADAETQCVRLTTMGPGRPAAVTSRSTHLAVRRSNLNLGRFDSVIGTIPSLNEFTVVNSFSNEWHLTFQWANSS